MGFDSSVMNCLVVKEKDKDCCLCESKRHYDWVKDFDQQRRRTNSAVIIQFGGRRGFGWSRWELDLVRFTRHR